MCFLSQMEQEQQQQEQQVGPPHILQQLQDRMLRLQQLQHERYQEKQQLLHEILQQMDLKRQDLQGIFQDFLLLVRLLQVLAPGNENHPSL